MMENVTGVLRGRRGEHLAQSMIGAFLSMVLMGSMVAMMGVMFTSQRTVQLTADRAADTVSMEAAFRQDVTWAANIPSEPASETGFTAVVPGTGIDGACRISTWVRDGESLRNISRTFERARQNPGAYTPGSESGSVGCIGAMVAEDSRSWDLPGSKVVFGYRDEENSVLFKSAESKMFTASADAKDPVRIGAVDFELESKGPKTHQVALNLSVPQAKSAATGQRVEMLAPPEGREDRTPGEMWSTWQPALHPDVYGGTHDCAPDEFPLVLPLKGQVDAKIDWGDGSGQEWANAPYPFHCYPNGNQREVKITGSFSGWGEKDNPLYGINAIGDENAASHQWLRIAERDVDDLLRQRTTWSSSALLKVDKWTPETYSADLSAAFYGAENLTQVTEIPPTATTLDGALAFTTKNVSGVGDWNTANVTSMKGTFQGATGFNASLSGWNTAQVTTMSSMFNGASAYNRPIDTWNTSKVTDMSQMFSGATSLNASVAGLDTASVTSMAQMFRDAVAFNRPVSALRTGSVRDMTGMFHNARAFNQPLMHANWDTSKVQSMAHMLEHAAAFDKSVAGLETPAVTSFNDMFRFAVAYNQPVRHFATDQATSLARMFMEARTFSQDVGGYRPTKSNPGYVGWKTSNVTDMSGMFSGASRFAAPVGDWDTSGVVTMSGMFHNADSFNYPLDGWDVSGVKDFSGMFAMTKIFDQPGINWWKPSSAQDMSFMFNGAESFNHDLFAWGEHLGKLKTADWMFANSPVYNKPLDEWDMSSVESMRNMFMGAKAFNQPIGEWDVQNVRDFSGMFSYAESFNQNIAPWKVSGAHRASSMFAQAKAFDQDLSTWNLSQTTGQNAGFAFGTKLANQPKKLPPAVRWQAE